MELPYDDRKDKACPFSMTGLPATALYIATICSQSAIYTLIIQNKMVREKLTSGKTSIRHLNDTSKCAEGHLRVRYTVQYTDKLARKVFYFASINKVKCRFLPPVMGSPQNLRAKTPAFFLFVSTSALLDIIIHRKDAFTAKYYGE